MIDAKFYRFVVLAGSIVFLPILRADESSGTETGGTGPTVEFFLPLIEAELGSVIDVPFQVRSSAPLSMISWSVEYDAGVMEFLEPVLTSEVEALMAAHPASESTFDWFVEADDEDEAEFEAVPELQGLQVVPSVVTDAGGRVDFEFEDGELEFKLRLENIDSVTRAEIRLGDRGDNGPTLAVLTSFDGDGLTVGNEASIVEEDLTNADLVAVPEAGFDGTVAELMRLMESGSVYVVVQTVDNPTGELRGQVGPKEEERDESWFQVSIVSDFLGREEFSIPADRLVDVAFLRFRVLDDAREGRHRLEFSVEESATFEGNFHDGDKIVFNVVHPDGQDVDDTNVAVGSIPAGVNDGTVILSIIGDIQILRVGDANHDRDIDISDSVRILRYLFVPGSSIACMAAADTNSDGAVNISDAIQLLNDLFSDIGTSTPVPVSTSGPIPPSADCY